MQNDIVYLKQKAIDIRRDIAEMTAKCFGIHIGPALSAADIITALYFNIMRIDPDNPEWEDRDRFILSKGHGYAALYSALAERGYFSKELLVTARQCGSILQGHPSLCTPGVDMNSGSLGNGIATGLGIALALKLKKKTHSKVYVMLGDGECDEGLVWEAAMAAPNLKLDNIVAIVDRNHFQSNGSTKEIMDLHPFAEKWKAFGWHVIEMNGHDMNEIVSKLTVAKECSERPVCIIAETVKGKGIRETEHNNKWHFGMFTAEQYKEAMADLDEQEKRLNEERGDSK